MCPLISLQRAESSRPGSIGGSRGSIFTSVSLPRSFSVWEGFRVVVRSLLRVPPARGNSLQLRIYSHRRTTSSRGARGGRGVYTARANSILKQQENKMHPQRQRGSGQRNSNVFFSLFFLTEHRQSTHNLLPHSLQSLNITTR